MKTFLVYIVVVFCCGIGTFFIYRHIQASHFNSTAVPYIYEVLPKITSWDPDLLDQIIASDILRQTDRADLVRLMASLSRLGTLESMGVSRLQTQSDCRIGPGAGKSGRHLPGRGLFLQWPRHDYPQPAPGRQFLIGLYHFNFQSEALGP